MNKLKTLLYSVILSLGSAGATRPALAVEPFASDQFVTEVLTPHPARGTALRVEYRADSGDALNASDRFVATVLIPQITSLRIVTGNSETEPAFTTGSAPDYFKDKVLAPPVNRGRAEPRTFELHSHLLRAPQAGELSSVR